MNTVKFEEISGRRVQEIMDQIFDGKLIPYRDWTCRCGNVFPLPDLEPGPFVKTLPLYSVHRCPQCGEDATFGSPWRVDVPGPDRLLTVGLACPCPDGDNWTIEVQGTDPATVVADAVANAPLCCRCGQIHGMCEGHYKKRKEWPIEPSVEAQPEPEAEHAERWDGLS